MSRPADTVSIPFRIDCGSGEYHSLLSWPFPSVPFYERQVLRVLAVDVPQRFAAGNCQCWIYKDGADEVVGFGAIQFMSEDCLSFAEPGKLHTYLVVLGTHPGHQKRGHGKRIFNHLFDLSIQYAAGQAIEGYDDCVYLDVYTTNTIAIGIYQKAGFTILNEVDPIPDPAENNETYYVMARKAR